MKARALLAVTKTRAKQLTQRLKSPDIDFDVATGSTAPGPLSGYRLLVLDIASKAGEAAAGLIAGLPESAHVVVLADRVDPLLAGRFLQDPRVNHFLSGETMIDDLYIIVQRLASGAIFGLDWYLPYEATIEYRRFATYKGRCDTIEAMQRYLKSQRVRSSIIRSAAQVLEELLMNAMYQAPVENGRRVFADVEPRQRTRKKTPRPVSVRYAVHEQRVFMSVRDRYGTFHRDDLAHYLLRCATSGAQIEEKKLGAGLGLFLVASTVSGLIVNVLPGTVAEVVCILGPKPEASCLNVLSICTQKAPIDADRTVEMVAEPLIPVG